MATRSLDNCSKTMFAHGKVQKVANYIGEQLIGMDVQDPLTGNEIPVVALEDSEATVSCISPISPSTNPRDFVLAEKIGLDRSPCTNLTGKIVSQNERINGLTLFGTANDGVVMELAAHEKIAKYSEELNSVYYRHKEIKDQLIMM
jgi:valyl-tRNA synthetase